MSRAITLRYLQAGVPTGEPRIGACWASLLSRRGLSDFVPEGRAIVARQELPGQHAKNFRVPEGRLILGERGIVGKVSPDLDLISAVPPGRIAFLTVSQALRAWLLSFGPSGTRKVKKKFWAGE